MSKCSHWNRQRDRKSILELHSILSLIKWRSKLEGSSEMNSLDHFLEATLRDQFSLSICECMSGTVAHFMTCKVTACLSMEGQGVKPLVQHWPAGNPCDSGSLWESLYSPQGLGLWPLFLSGFLLNRFSPTSSQVSSTVQAGPHTIGRLLIQVQCVSDTEHLASDCTKEPSTIYIEQVGPENFHLNTAVLVQGEVDYLLSPCVVPKCCIFLA